MVRLGCGSEDEAKAGVEVVSSTNYGLALRAVDLKIKKKKSSCEAVPPNCGHTPKHTLG